MVATMSRFLFGSAIICYLGTVSFAQERASESRFSHKGLKAAIATASFDMIDERGLEEGEGGSLSIGYGFSDRFSIWATFLGSEHESSIREGNLYDFGGVELNFQHKFETEQNLQPYGKLGFGVYALEQRGSNAVLIGAGINLGLGVDYFFSRHFGIGAELMYKKLDYFEQSEDVGRGDLVTDLDPNLNGDTLGFMLTLTIQ